MKPLLTATIVAVAALSLWAAVILALCGTRSPLLVSGPSPWISNPSMDALAALTECLPQPGIHQGQSKVFVRLKNDEVFALSKPQPLYLGKKLRDQPLPPGVYQTYPYAIILAVPRRGIDDGILGEIPNTNSTMPVIKPPVEVVPKQLVEQ